MPFGRRREKGDGPAVLGAIETPGPGSSVRRAALLVGGWALGAGSPVSEVLLLIDGKRAARAETGSERPHVAAAHGGTEDALRSGWEAEVDLRAAGESVSLRLMARTEDGAWHEVAESDLRVEGNEATRPRAVFTIVQNEPVFLSLWLAHYGADFAPEDIYVLDHDSTDGSTDGIEDRCTRIAVHRDRAFDHMWLAGVVQDFQTFLLRSYRTVLFSEADELVAVDPERPGGLAAYMDEFEGVAATSTGFNVLQQPGEQPLDFSRPVLRQRTHWNRSPQYSKRLMSRVPLRWNAGFHREYNVPGSKPDPDLMMIHLHRVDYDLCLERHRSSSSREWAEEDRKWNLGWHQRVTEPEEFREWFYSGEDLEGSVSEPIPERLRDVL